MVLAITAPQPSWKALVITFKFVPGGPEAMTNGFGSFSPSTVSASVAIISALQYREQLSKLEATKNDSSCNVGGLAPIHLRGAPGHLGAG